MNVFFICEWFLTFLHS